MCGAAWMVGECTGYDVVVGGLCVWFDPEGVDGANCCGTGEDRGRSCAGGDCHGFPRDSLACCHNPCCTRVMLGYLLTYCPGPCCLCSCPVARDSSVSVLMPHCDICYNWIHQHCRLSRDWSGMSLLDWAGIMSDYIVEIYYCILEWL